MDDVRNRPAGGTPTALLGGGDRLGRAELIFRIRRRRDLLLAGGSVGLKDPAWDILLDLYIARSRGRASSVSGVCYSAGLPLPTGMRYLTRLQQAALVRRYRDPADGRREIVELTDEGVGKLDDLLGD